MRHALIVGLGILLVSAAFAGCAASDESIEATQPPSDGCGPQDQNALPDRPTQPEDVDQPPGCP